MFINVHFPVKKNLPSRLRHRKHRLTSKSQQLPRCCQKIPKSLNYTSRQVNSISTGKPQKGITACIS